jgi:aspartyl-tRNA(Asn)/glutamyl-tRNA(Gln) amidotransferase subunit A
MPTPPAAIADDVVALGRAFRAGAASPRDAVDLCLARIAEGDGALNAFALVLPERARAAADRAGAELAAGIDRGPLHGVPVAIKDLIDLAGAPTGYGSGAAQRDRPARSAALVERLEAAGAVILGKNALLEFAYGAVHPDVGQTNNPWDPARTAGGSSGGGAAAVAAGLCWGAVGTDTGGSIRIPAAYCGIVGLKPSFGLVDMRGVFPLSPTLDHAGPMARTAADALLLLDGMTGSRGPVDPIPPAALRLGVLLDHAADPVIRPDVRAAFARACATLRGAGATVVERRLPELAGFVRMVLDILLPEAGVIHAARLATRPEAYGPQTRAQIEAGPTVSAMAYLDAQAARRRLTAAYAAALEGLDALIAPSVPWTAPAEDPAVDGDEGFAEMHCSALANLTGAPSVSVFGGLGADGMPVGLTLNGEAGRDRCLMRIAAGIETLIPPATPPRRRDAR